jgi:hypothetical protein
MKAWSQLKALHADRRGAIAPVMILCFIFFGFMVIMILNTGQVVGDKIRVQNGADAAAMVQGDWTASHLNTMSMNNVALTQSYTALVVSTTVLQVVTDFMQRAQGTKDAIMAHAEIACAILLWGYAACVEAYEAYTIPCDIAIAAGATYLARYDPMYGIWAGRANVSALNAMNDYLVQSLPDRVGRIATQMLPYNDIDSVFYYPPCDTSVTGCRADRSIQGSRLPVDGGAIGRGAAFKELCDAASTGSDGSHRLNFDKLGYPRGKGPYTSGGSSSNPHVRDYISQETGLGLMLELFYWTYPVRDPLLGTEFAPIYDDPQSVEDNNFTTTMNSNWNTACGGGADIAVGLASGLVGGLVPTPYLLKGNTIGALMGGGYAGQIASMLSGTEDFQFLAYAARRHRSIVSVDLYDTAMKADYGYGQSYVFNPSSSDLYTQNWQAMLMPSKWMDQPSQVLDGLDQRAASDFNELVTVMKRGGNTDAFKVVNVH